MNFLFKVLFFCTLFFSLLSNASDKLSNNSFSIKLKPYGTHVIISFELKNHSKFYWRNAGELGLPTSFSFEKSSNLKDAKVYWPLPEIYEKDGIASYIYSNTIDFVVKLTPKNPNKLIDFITDIDFSICQQGCSNYSISLSTSTNPSEKIISEEVIEALAKTPALNGTESLTIKNVEQELVDGHHWLNIEFSNDKTIINPKIFLDLPNYISYEPNNFSLISSQNKQIIRIPFKINDNKHRKINDEVYLVLAAENGIAIEYSTIPKTINLEDENSKLAWILLIALLGGIILNIMPCVLPVLGLKLLQIVKISQQSKTLIRKSLIAQSLGIICTFICFAIATYILQFLGYKTGLGIHFQQPFYIISMTLVLALVAINLLSEKEMILHVPQFLIKIFHVKSEQANAIGFFASGILSTLLAIPCAAPFVTIAIGFALTADFVRMLIIFAVIGIGMSLPYLLILAFPNIIKILPKPGPWMIRFKKFVAIAIIATCLWLIFILSTQLGLRSAAIIFLLLLLIKFVINESEVLSKKLKAFILIILISLAFILPHNLRLEKEYKETFAEQNWHAYDPSLIPDLIKNGQIVIVDVSASWCATCSINKITTLENISVINSLNKLNVFAMKADISKETSDIIAKLLNSKNHHAVPLTIIYSKKHPNGIKLPTILTPHILLSNIKKEL